MQFSKETLEVLKNFSTMNPNILLQKGSKLKTISIQRTIFGTAEIPETIPTDFGIYDLTQFLGVLSLFESPELEFKDKYVNISEGKNGIKYFAADRNVLQLPPEKDIKFPDTFTTVDLDKIQLQQILKVSGVLGAPDVSLVGDGDNLKIVVTDLSQPNANKFDIEMGETDKKFTANLKVENLKMMPQKYQIDVSSKKISRWVSEDKKMTVFVGLETTSDFDE